MKSSEGEFLKRGLVQRYFLIFLVVVLVVVGISWTIGQVFLPSKQKIEIDYPQLKKEATSLYQKAAYKKAIPKLENYLRKNKKDTEARRLLTFSYWQSDQTEKAFEQSKILLKANPSDVDTLYRLGLLARQLGEIKEAIKYLAQAVEKRPQDYSFRAELARAYFQNKNYEEAISQWEEVLKLFPPDNPERASVYGQIGDIYLDKNERGKAVEAYQKGLALQPENEYLQSQLMKVQP